MKLRVLMVGQFAKRKGENDGGVSAVMSYLTEALLERGDIDLFGARFGAAAGDVKCDQELGFPVYNLPATPFGLLSGFHQQRRLFKSIVREVEPDIVHGQGADVTGLMAIDSERPAIVTVHGIIGEDARYKSRLRDRIRESISSKFIEEPVIRRAKSFILISPYVAEYYGDAMQGLVHHIPNPVGRSYFELLPQPQAGRVLYAGRVIPRKGILDLVSAFARLTHPADRRLLIAGSLSDATYVGEVRKRIRELGIADRVELPGLLKDSDLMKEFVRAQVLVLPSYQETAPMVILQAMAGGLPVIATRICGVPYQISDGVTGLLHEPGDVIALHRHLDRLISDGGLARRMGDAGRNVAKSQFHANSVAEATVNAYRFTVANSVKA